MGVGMVGWVCGGWGGRVGWWGVEMRNRMEKVKKEFWKFFSLFFS